jgi:very-short-patch-repair endonuclease
MEALTSIHSKLPTGNFGYTGKPNSPHAMLWTQLNENLVLGLPFDYKVNMEGYLLDFYCPQLGLAIEIVPTLSLGGNITKDLHKEKVLKMNGIKVLQFSHYDVAQQMNVVITTIKYWIKTYKRAAA